MLWLFVNTFTANDKYPAINRDNFTQPIQIQLSRKRKSFSQFLSRVSKCGLNFNSFKKKLTLIANVIPKLQTRKEEIR